MNLQLLFTKNTLKIMYVLSKHGVCDDLIETIIYSYNYDNIVRCTRLLKLDLKEQVDLFNIIQRYTYEKNWIINYKPRPAKKLYVLHPVDPVHEQTVLTPTIKDEHIRDCRCDQCIHHFDYPRYSYLHKKVMNPYRGHTSKEYNRWFYYLLSICSTGYNNIQDRSPLSGFCSQYNRLDKYKVNYNKEYVHNLFLKNDKSKIIKMTDIWGILTTEVS